MSEPTNIEVTCREEGGANVAVQMERVGTVLVDCRTTPISIIVNDEGADINVALEEERDITVILQQSIETIGGNTPSDGEVHMTPKPHSDNPAEGTMFYCSEDNSVYVGTE